MANWKTVKEYQDITYKKCDGVARIAFNRPEVRNAFRPQTLFELEEMYMPLYLAAGENDQKYVKRMSEISDSLRNASFEIVQNAGHRIHADQPDKLVHLLNFFIETHHGKLENC